MKSAQFKLHASIEETHWWFLGRRHIMREVVRRALPQAKSHLIVDVGCGTGGNLAALMPDYACAGIDMSPEAVQLARTRFPQAQFVCGSIPDDLKDLRDHASLFLLMDVLEHVPDDFLLLSTLFSIMRPGAYVFITVPAHMALWTQHDLSFGHYRRYDAERLRRVWAGLPVTTCLMSYYNARLYPIVKAVRMVNRLRGRTDGMAGTNFVVPPPAVNRLLTSIFASEARVLADCVEGTRRRGFASGVSLVALLRREDGPLTPRTKPADIPPDAHTP